MKNTLLLILFWALLSSRTHAQELTLSSNQKKDIYALIDQYSLAREKRDTVLLKSILTSDVDQLVSSGEWRTGVGEAVKGMLRSSESNAGSRKIIVDRARLLTVTSGVVDARYEIQNSDGTTRKMWSTFLVLYQGNKWKIAAIRNMLPQR
jgi:hypothetical protein